MWELGEVFDEIVDKLKERRSLYKEPNPLVLMTDEDFIHMMRVKLLRVQYGRAQTKRRDDLLDLLAYGAWLLRRWTKQVAKVDTNEQLQEVDK